MACASRTTCLVQMLANNWYKCKCDADHIVQRDGLTFNRRLPMPTISRRGPELLETHASIFLTMGAFLIAHLQLPLLLRSALLNSFLVDLRFGILLVGGTEASISTVQQAMEFSQWPHCGILQQHHPQSSSSVCCRTAHDIVRKSPSWFLSDSSTISTTAAALVSGCTLVLVDPLNALSSHSWLRSPQSQFGCVVGVVRNVMVKWMDTCVFSRRP